MHLIGSDAEKLLLAVAGMVARDRRARGILLNHPETVALLSTWVIERAREGATVTQIMAEGGDVLTPEEVMPGVPGLLHDVQVEATFPDGRKLVTLHHPLGHDDEGPGALRVAEGSIELNADRSADERRTVTKMRRATSMPPSAPSVDAASTQSTRRVRVAGTPPTSSRSLACRTCCPAPPTRPCRTR